MPFAFFCILLGCGAGNVKGDGSLGEGESSRPRLYLHSNVLGQIKANIDKDPYLTFWKAIRAKAIKYTGDLPPSNALKIQEGNLWMLGDGLPYMAISYLISGQRSYLAGVRKWMDALSSYPDWGGNKDVGAANLLFDMAVTYDWLYAEFTSAELARYRNKIKMHADILYKSLVKQDIWWSRKEYHMQNHNYQNVMAIAIAAIALSGEIDEADGWLAASKANFDSVLGLLSPDGASHEGVGYWGGGLDAMLKYFLANPTLGGRRQILQNEFFRNTARFRLYASIPGYREIADYADSPRYEWSGPGHMLRALSSIFRDGHAQWLANQVEQARGDKANYSWLNLVWFDETVEPISPEALPKFAYFDNLGIFIGRSDWSENALWVLFKAGSPQGRMAQLKGIYTGSHIHPDAGTFLLWASGAWLVIDDGYVYKKRTENHNVLLFNGIGQLGEGKEWFDLEAVKRHRGASSVVFKNLQPNFQYLTAELAGIYPPEAGVRSWQRTFIVLPRGRLVLRDQITWKKTGKAVSRIHFARQPKRCSGGKIFVGDKKGLVLEALSPVDASLKLGKYEISDYERTRSTNYEGGLLEIVSAGSSDVFLFLLNAKGICAKETDLKVSAHGDFLRIREPGSSITIDFRKKTTEILSQ